jgi:membrane protease YdiL (CAAX protease family)
MNNNQEENSQKDTQLPLRTVTTVILGYFPLALVGYLSFMARQDQEQLSVILSFMWVIGGVISAWVLYLQISFMQKSVRELNISEGCLTRELIHTLALAGILIALWFGFQAISPKFQGFNVFFGEISQDATQQAVFLTASLFLWAVYEELIRVFTLNRTWELVRSDRWKTFVLIVNTLVFALAYAYQGWGAIAAAGVGGLFLGAYYQKKGRILPLILAHYLLHLAVFMIRIYFT